MLATFHPISSQQARRTFFQESDWPELIIAGDAKAVSVFVTVAVSFNDLDGCHNFGSCWIQSVMLERRLLLLAGFLKENRQGTSGRATSLTECLTEIGIRQGTSGIKLTVKRKVHLV